MTEHATQTLEDLRKAFPNYKTHQDHQPVGERDRCKENDRRIAWMREHKPSCHSDWFNFNRRGTVRSDD